MNEQDTAESYDDTVARVWGSMPMGEDGEVHVPEDIMDLTGSLEFSAFSKRAVEISSMMGFPVELANKRIAEGAVMMYLAVQAGGLTLSDRPAEDVVEEAGDVVIRRLREIMEEGEVTLAIPDGTFDERVERALGLMYEQNIDLAEVLEVKADEWCDAKYEEIGEVCAVHGVDGAIELWLRARADVGLPVTL